MIKVKDIAEKFGEYGIDEEELKEILIKPKPKTVWDLKNGDKYFYLTNDKRFYCETWDNSLMSSNRRLQGNVFLTIRSRI